HAADRAGRLAAAEREKLSIGDPPDSQWQVGPNCVGESVVRAEATAAVGVRAERSARGSRFPFLARSRARAVVCRSQISLSLALVLGSRIGRTGLVGLAAFGHRSLGTERHVAKTCHCDRR